MSATLVQTQRPRPAAAAARRRSCQAGSENLTAYGLLCAALDGVRAVLLVPDRARRAAELPAGRLRQRADLGRLDNFQRLFDDPLFGVAWRNTLLFTGLALVFGFAVPFAMAVVLNEIRHAKAYFRLVVYLPVMLPPVVTALLWKWFYDPGPGLFNYAAARGRPARLAVAGLVHARRCCRWCSSPRGPTWAARR